MKIIFLVIFLILPWISLSGGERQPVTPSPGDKCPVCGMFVIKYPDFLAQVLFADGSYALFDGTKDMFKYLVQPETKGPPRKRPGIDSVYVTDYYSLSLVDGLRAYYVIGSDVYGPMGKELIPFAREDDAREFVKDHKGKSILRFREVTPEVIKVLE